MIGELVKQQINIRPLEAVDIDGVVNIEQLAHEYPWKKSIHFSCIEEEYPSLVLELDGKLNAYVVFNYLYDECHLMNITTHPEHQGRGLASLLIKALYDNAKSQGMKNVLLEVRESNGPALAFYRKEGFEDIGRRSNYYPSKDGPEAAVIMRRSL
jgi:ribosomal-protein-alanine N-acetyltransferase